MIEKMSERRFTNAVVREAAAISKRLVERNAVFGSDIKQTLTLAIERLGNARIGKQELWIVLRGNVVGTHWMVLDKGFLFSLEGWQAAHALTHKIALNALYAALKKDCSITTWISDGPQQIDPQAVVTIEVPSIPEYREFFAVGEQA